MGGRVYYAPFNDVTLTNVDNQDIWELGAVTNKVILHGFSVSSDVTSIIETADVYVIKRSTSGNGSALVEVNRNPDDSTPLAVAESIATTPGTSDGPTYFSVAWRMGSPCTYIFYPDLRPSIEAGSYIVLHYAQDGDSYTSRSGSATLSGWVCWEEV